MGRPCPCLPCCTPLQVRQWQGLCLVVLYVAYVCLSIWMPREEEEETFVQPEVRTELKILPCAWCVCLCGPGSF